MNSQVHKTNLNDNMIEISKTLETLKTNRMMVEKDIESQEIYREKLYEKLKEYSTEVEKINGIREFII